MVILAISDGIGVLPLKTQDKTESLTTHYVLPAFVQGSVLLKTGQKEAAIMDYNMLSEEMIFEKGGTRLAIDKIETIDTVYLAGKKFVPHEKFFFEVLVNDNISLFIRHKCNLLPAGSPSGYGGKSETSASTSISMLAGSGSLYKLKLPVEYHVTDASQFWIEMNNLIFRISSERQLIKTFPEISKEINQFIKLNRLDIRKEKDITAVIVKCNELLN